MASIVRGLLPEELLVKAYVLGPEDACVQFGKAAADLSEDDDVQGLAGLEYIEASHEGSMFSVCLQHGDLLASSSFAMISASQKRKSFVL